MNLVPGLTFVQAIYFRSPCSVFVIVYRCIISIINYCKGQENNNEADLMVMFSSHARRHREAMQTVMIIGMILVEAALLGTLTMSTLLRTVLRGKNNNNLLGIFSIFLWLHMCTLLCNKTYNQMKLSILIPTPLRGHRRRKIKLFIYVHLSVFVRTVSSYMFFLAYGVISSEWLSKTLFCECVTL